MRRRWSARWRAVCGLLLLLALAWAPPAAWAATTPGPGQAFPALSEFGLEGELPDLDAAKVVIVDFWASWCAPCKASFPAFEALKEEYADRGLVIVGVSEDQNVAAMEGFVQRMRPGFAIVRDAEQKLAAAVNVPAMPTSFVLDGKGTVRFVHRGFRGAESVKELRTQIESLLKEQG